MLKMHPFKSIYASVVFSIVTSLCKHHHSLIPEYCDYPRKKPHPHEQSFIYVLSPWMCPI